MQFFYDPVRSTSRMVWSPESGFDDSGLFINAVSTAAVELYLKWSWMLSIKLERGSHSHFRGIILVYVWEDYRKSLKVSRHKTADIRTGCLPNISSLQFPGNTLSAYWNDANIINCNDGRFGVGRGRRFVTWCHRFFFFLSSLDSIGWAD
jgi:hypothetical protein